MLLRLHATVYLAILRCVVIITRAIIATIASSSPSNTIPTTTSTIPLQIRPQPLPIPAKNDPVRPHNLTLTDMEINMKRERPMTTSPVRREWERNLVTERPLCHVWMVVSSCFVWSGDYQLENPSFG